MSFQNKMIRANSVLKWVPQHLTCPKMDPTTLGTSHLGIEVLGLHLGLLAHFGYSLTNNIKHQKRNK